MSLRKLIAFDDDTFDKLKQLGRDRMATLQELADEAFADLLKKHGIPVDLKDALRKSAAGSRRLRTPKKTKIKKDRENGSIMTTDPDPFEGATRRARKHSRRSQSISDGSEQHALWLPATRRSPARSRLTRAKEADRSAT